MDVHDHYCYYESYQVIGRGSDDSYKLLTWASFLAVEHFMRAFGGLLARLLVLLLDGEHWNRMVAVLTY